MTDEILQHTLQLREARTPFVLATVIQVRGSASARPGSKAVISADGRNLAGWVGGGCAEAYVCNQSMECLEEQRPRVITADLDDEIFGLGMPCGGVMDVYLEPILPPAHLVLPVGDPELAKNVSWFARQLGLQIREGLTHPTDMVSRASDAPDEARTGERALLVLARAIAHARGRDGRPLADVKYPDLPPKPRALRRFIEAPSVFITGRGRITEELARFTAQLGWPVTLVTKDPAPELYPSTARIVRETPDLALRPGSGDFVVIASHHKGDPLWIRRSLEAGASFVGLIASAHRVGLIRDELLSEGLSMSDWERVRAPAGLDLDCRNPAEIALSLVAEMLILNLSAREALSAEPT